MKLSTKKIIATREGAIGFLVFNNPEKHNALSLEMWVGISEAMTGFDADDEIRVVVLKGAGGKSFISGADISQFEERRSTAEKADDYNTISGRAWNALARTPKPVIAAIDGYCIGGGLAVAMKADIRIATRVSKFGVPAARLGLAYGEHSIRDLVNLVGPSEAKWILFTGQQLDAVAALRIGLINAVVEPGELDDEVTKLCENLIENAPLSLRASKETVDQIATGRVDRARLAELATQCIGSSDFAEGRRAFVEKRKPRFTGK